jgi:hypothetical protein
MRTLLAIVIFVGGIFVANAPADARRYHKRYYYPSAQAACEQRAQHADRTGVYRGFPCWAREAFGQGTLGGGRGGRR